MFEDKELMRKGIIGGVLLLLIIISIFIIAPKASKPETYKHTIEKLEKKQATVLELTGASSAASVALAAVPGDVTTPIANKIMDMAGYFIIILSVIILEKYMLTIAGYLTFTWLLPAACILYIINLFFEKRVISQLALKLLVLGIAMVTIVPVSVKLTDVIEKTNEDSINQSIENIRNLQKEAEESVEGETGAQTEQKSEQQQGQNSGTASDEESGSIFDALEDMKSRVNALRENTVSAIEEAGSSITRLSQQAIEKAKTTIGDFVEVVVIMLVTTCGVPLLTLVVFGYLIKSFLNLDFDRFLENNFGRLWEKNK